MITLHHLGISQSERIVWLLEELGLPYKIVKHYRAPILSPDSLKIVPGNKSGKAPFIEDDEAGITLSESGAIVEYIINMYGGGKLALKPGDKEYSQYLKWLHFANGTLQAEMVTSMFLGLSSASPDEAIRQTARERLDSAWQQLDDRLATNKWLAGDEFTAADIMTVYCCTTQRHFGPQEDLSGYTNILRWLKDVNARPGYQQAMSKGDPEMRVQNEAKPPESMMEKGGIESPHWKKK